MAIHSVAGWLPYGVTDESVLFQADMKSAASITANTGTISVLGSGTQTFDSNLGMDVGSSGGYRILQMTGYATLDYSGQISVEVQREYICKDDATNGSTGITLGAQGYVLSTLPGTGSAQAPIYKTTGGAVGSFLLGGTTNKKWVRGSVDTGTTVNCQIHSLGKDDYVRINVGWWGNQLVIAVDGYIVCSSLLNRSTIANLFNNLYICSDRGLSGFVNGYYVRNLQISNRAPMFAVHPDLSSLILFGDSYVNTTDLTVTDYTTITSPWYESTGVYQIQKELESKGLFVGNMWGLTCGGHTINDSANSGTASGALQTYRATALAQNPQYVFLRAGTNDANTTTLDANFDTDLKDHITTILGTTNVKGIVVGTVPAIYNDSTKNSNVTTVNNYINALPDWWDTNNPSDTGRVAIADVFTAFGGFNYPGNVYYGQIIGTGDIHPSAYGYELQSQAYVNALMTMLGTL